MRVLFLSSLWPPRVLGGAELYAASLADRLSARGHEIGVVTLGVDAPLVVEQLKPWPYPLDEFESQPAWKRALLLGRDVHDPTAWRAIVRAIDRFRPDVVHSHSVKGMSGNALAAVGGAGVPHVHHLHDYWLLCRRTTLVQESGVRCDAVCAPCRAIGAVRALEARRGRVADVCIAVSQHVANRHRPLRWLDVPVHVVRHAGEAAARRDDVVGGRPVVFGFLGQLAAVKGVGTLLEAHRRVGPDRARLVVAGRGPSASVVRGEGVDLLGWISGATKEAFWADIDCLVVPSEWEEPAGLVAVEARERGVPVIAAGVGGLPEYVDAASRPLLFRAGDVADLVRSMAKVLADPNGYRPAPGTVDVTWDDHVGAIESAYGEAIQRSR